MPVTTYAAISDVNAAINAAALTGIDDPRKTAAIAGASAEADDYLRDQYTLPLQTNGSASLTIHVANIAVYRLMVGRGYNPEAGGDPGIRDRYKDAIDWLKLVAAGKVTPNVTDSAPETTGPGSSGGAVPQVITSPQRGYSYRGDPNGRSGPFQGG